MPDYAEEDDAQANLGDVFKRAQGKRGMNAACFTAERMGNQN